MTNLSRDSDQKGDASHMSRAQVEQDQQQVRVLNNSRRRCIEARVVRAAADRAGTVARVTTVRRRSDSTEKGAVRRAAAAEARARLVAAGQRQ
jgi:hypothetical protein